MPQSENVERLDSFGINNATIEHLHRYTFTMALVHGKAVLDIACGEGYGSYFLAQNAAHVIGIDIDASTITNAKRKYKKSNLEFKTGSVLQIPEPNNTFDVVVCFETLEHIVDQDKMVNEVKRVLKTGGVFIVSTPDKRYYTDEAGNMNPFHLKELYADDFKSLIARYFQKATYLQQSFIAGSLLIPENRQQGLMLFTGDNIKIDLNVAPTPLYLIAIASDVEIPQTDTSLFYNQKLIPKLKNDKEGITKTMTYRVGHFFLSPYKYVRSIFRKSK